MEVGAAQRRLQRLEPVVAGQAATEPHADIAERQIDLVVQDEDPIELDMQFAARRANRSARLVHVCLRFQDRDAGTARAGAALGDQAAIPRLGLPQVPSPA